MDNPSVKEANQLLRVLNGNKLKYTCRVILPDGKEVEFQAALQPSPKFFVEDRCLWLFSSEKDYGSIPIMKWVEGSVLLCEENPI